MLVSIVTPSFNQAKYLPDLIQSIRSQSYRPVEHIVIDGASTDDTVSLLKEYEKNPDGITVTWVSEKDRGQAHAINKGFKMVKGDIVGWINSDDAYFHKGVLNRVVSEFEKHPEVDIIHGDLALISSESLVGIFWCLPEFNYERMFVNGRIAQATIFFRRKVIEENKLREGFLSLDYEFWLRLGKKYRFRHVNDIFACDRDQPERITRTQTARLKESHIKAQNDNPPHISKTHRLWYKTIDLPQRLFLRLKGLYRFLKVKNSNGYFAFSVQTDRTTSFIRRQLFGRIGNLFEPK